MKMFRSMIASIACLALLAGSSVALAQVGPGGTVISLNPTPQTDAVTLATTGDYYFSSDYATASASVRVSALSGTLAAAIQASNDPLSTTNASASWTTLYSLNAAAPNTAPAASISANGLYTVNTAGFTRFRVHVTTLSGGSHVVTLMAAANIAPSGVYVLNPASAAASAPPATQALPYGATAKTASATGTTGATTATLTPTSGKTIYLCGFSVRANATAAATGNATVTGTITGTLNFTQWTAPLASGLGIVEPHLGQCVPASAADQAVAVVSAAPGSGGVVSVSAWGYEQ